MRTENYNKRTPALQIKGGGRIYQLDLEPLMQFLDCLKQRVNISDVQSLVNQLEEIADRIIDGTDDQVMANQLKNPLIVMRQLTLMLNGMLWDVTPEKEAN